MQSRKNFILLLACLLLVSSIMVFPASAATVNSNDQIPAGALPPTPEEIAYWEAIAAEKDAALPMQADAGVYSTGVWIYTTQGVLYYAQEKSYTCGAACARMVLYNIANLSLSEATIETGSHTTSSGVTTSNLGNYINDVQGYYYYTPSYTMVQSTFESRVFNTLATYGKPVIVGLMTNTSMGFANTGGPHFVVVYAARRTYDAEGNFQYEFKVADPWAGFVGNTSKKYVALSYGQLFSAYSSAGVGFLY